MAGGATFRLETEGKARHWMQRAYTYRSLLHKQQATQLSSIIETRQTSTPYDSMMLKCEGRIVLISFDVIEGVLLDGEGNPLELPDTSSLTPDLDEIKLDDEELEILEEVERDLKLELKE